MNRISLFRWNSQLRLKAKLSTSAKNFEFMANKGFQVKNTNLSLSSGIFGHLSESSVMCRTGGSVLHASVNSSRAKEPNESGLPLTVDYRARQYAFGLIPVGKNRREIHGSQDELLVARFIDRAVRPLFPKGYVNEIQLTVTSHAADGVHDPTVAAVNAASYALMKSNQPWNGPIGCVRVGLVDGVLKVDPTLKEMETSTLDFLYAGTAGRALMIETAGNQIPEETIKAALRLAHSSVQDIIVAQSQAINEERSEKRIAFEATAAAKAEATKHIATIDATSATESTELSIASVYTGDVKRLPFVVSPELKAAVFAMGHSRATEMYAAGGLTKTERGRGEGRLRGELIKSLAEDPVWSLEHLVVRKMAVDAVLNSAFRGVLLEQRPRIDGRQLNQLRDISCAVEVMPSVHGSAYFARGDTHVLSTTTLGSKTDAMEVLPISGTGEVVQNHFMLHYDFPPYCTGEMGNVTSVNRRMVGHGKLAERGVRGVMPSVDAFPYTVRVYSECTSSNGSSSMASVCSASLALMDAGVPILAPVAGLSVGLITHDNLSDMLPALEASYSTRLKSISDASVETSTSDLTTFLPASTSRPYVLLKDILGTEDHNGDMDFKIAGSATGVTAIQLDVKLEGGVPLFMLEEALDVAREGRLEILSTMSKTIAASRDDFKSNAPRGEMVSYDPERRQQLTGVGGEMIKYMQELYEVEIDTTVEGVAYIFGKNAKNVADCRSLVQDIAVLVKAGDVLSAQVLDVKDFGLLVKVNRAQEGLLHVSDISHDPELIKRPLEELFTVGQRLDVKVYSVDKATGNLKVSRKALMDPHSTVPDHISNQATATTISFEDLPTFPVIPPRKFNKDYFRDNVATAGDVKEAMGRYAASHTYTPPPETATVRAPTAPPARTSPPPPTSAPPVSARSSPRNAYPPSAPAVVSRPVQSPAASVSHRGDETQGSSSVRTRIISAVAPSPVAPNSTLISNAPSKSFGAKPSAASAAFEPLDEGKHSLWGRLKTVLPEDANSKSSNGPRTRVISSGGHGGRAAPRVFSNSTNKLTLQSGFEERPVRGSRDVVKSGERPLRGSNLSEPPPVNAVLRDSISRTYASNNSSSGSSAPLRGGNSRIIGGVPRAATNDQQRSPAVKAEPSSSAAAAVSSSKPSFQDMLNKFKVARSADITKVGGEEEEPVTIISAPAVTVSDRRHIAGDIRKEFKAKAAKPVETVKAEESSTPSSALESVSESSTLKFSPSESNKGSEDSTAPKVKTVKVRKSKKVEIASQSGDASVLATALNKLIFSDSSPPVTEKKTRTKKASKVAVASEATTPAVATDAMNSSHVPLSVESTESAAVAVTEVPVKPKRKVSSKKASESPSISASPSTEGSAAVSESLLQGESSAPVAKRARASAKKVVSSDTTSTAVAAVDVSSASEASPSAVGAEEVGEAAPKKRKTAVRKAKTVSGAADKTSE